MIIQNNAVSSQQKQDIRSLFEQADGILVVAANGFSIAEGFAILKNSPWFASEFADFQKKYGFQAPIQAMTYPYSDPKEYQTFNSRLMKQIHYDKPVSEVMKELQAITSLKPTFVLTTNGEDRFVQAGYPEQDVFYMEGRFNHRTDHSLIKREELDEIVSGNQIETAMYPQSAAFKEKVTDLNRFLQQHPRLLILELGVSARNEWLRPVVQRILSGNRQAWCIEFNQMPNPIPSAYANRVIQIPGSLQSTLSELKSIVQDKAAAE